MKFVNDRIPKKHIGNVYNPKADRNCGFRSIAHELYGDENEWKQVKQQMLDHFEANIAFYQQFFLQDDVDRARRILLCRDEEVPQSYYFTSPEHCRIACETFKRTIVFMSSQQYADTTFVPMQTEPVVRRPIFLQLHGLHFYLVQLKPNARCNKYLPTLYPGHENYCRKRGITDYSHLYF